MRVLLYLYTISARLKFLRGYKVIVIYGRQGCGACENVKMILNKRNIGFTYIDMSQMDEKGFDVIMKSAEQAGIQSMPIIMQDGQITTVAQVLQ